MRAARKLRVVPNCPQSERPPYRPTQYGQGPWPERLAHSPTGDELTIRCRAQSILSRGGKRAEIPDLDTARKIIARANKPRVRIPVTVPQPLCRPAQENTPTPVECAQAGSQQNPFIGDEAPEVIERYADIRGV